MWQAQEILTFLQLWDIFFEKWKYRFKVSFLVENIKVEIATFPCKTASN